MTFKESISEVGSLLFGLVAMLALLLIPVVFLAGAVVVAEEALPWLMRICFFVLGINILIFLPMAFISGSRPWAGLGIFISSYVCGLTTWLMGLLFVWTLWGGFFVFVGIILGGIGVVFLAMLATLFEGMWIPLGMLVLGVVVTIGMRIVGWALISD